MVRRASRLSRQTIEGGSIERPEEQLFVSIVGYHAAGFPAADDPIELRGVHVLPLDEVIRLRDAPVERTARIATRSGDEIRFTSLDIREFLRRLLRPEPHAWELLASPLVVFDSGSSSELRRRASTILTRDLYHPYRSELRREISDDGAFRDVGGSLDTLRRALTGIHALRASRIEQDLAVLTEARSSSTWLRAEAASRSTTGERAIDDELSRRYRQEAARLASELDDAMEQTLLPASARSLDSLDDFLVRVRRDGPRAL